MHCWYQILDGNIFFSLQLNKDKTEVLLVGLKALRHWIVPFWTPLLVKPCERAKNLGVVSDANFQNHVANISNTAFCHLRSKSKVRVRVQFVFCQNLTQKSWIPLLITAAGFLLGCQSSSKMRQREFQQKARGLSTSLLFMFYLHWLIKELNLKYCCCF